VFHQEKFRGEFEHKNSSHAALSVNQISKDELKMIEYSRLNNDDGDDVSIFEEKNLLFSLPLMFPD
jgi:hypothetical protein